MHSQSRGFPILACKGIYKIKSKLCCLTPAHPTPFGAEWLRLRHSHLIIRSHSVNISNPPTAAAAAKHPFDRDAYLYFFGGVKYLYLFIYILPIKDTFHNIMLVIEDTYISLYLHSLNQQVVLLIATNY